MKFQATEANFTFKLKTKKQVEQFMLHEIAFHSRSLSLIQETCMNNFSMNRIHSHDNGKSDCLNRKWKAMMNLIFFFPPTKASAKSQKTLCGFQ